MTRLSIIVPMLNEAAVLSRLIETLGELTAQGCEVMVVDGGSQDGSVETLEQAGLTVLRSAQGRAYQMNAGAAATTGEVLLFLHADTELPGGAVVAVEQALADDDRGWGRFDVRIEGRALMLRVVAALMNARSRLSGMTTGDQALFVRRHLFTAIGGFPDQPLMEDIEISRRLLKHSRPACLRLQVLTSGRRWERNGLWRTIWLMWKLRWAYWRGVSADRLAEVYR